MSLICGWSVCWVFSGQTLHSYQAQQGRSNFLCPVFTEDSVIVVPLAHGCCRAWASWAFCAMLRIAKWLLCAHNANSCESTHHETWSNNASVHPIGLRLNMRALGSCPQDRGLTMRTSRVCAQVKSSYYFNCTAIIVLHVCMAHWCAFSPRTGLTAYMPHSLTW